MRRGMKKLWSLTVRHYGANLIELKEYLVSFPGANLTDKIGVTESNKRLLKSVPTRWSNQAYVQGFECEYINFKNMLI